MKISKILFTSFFLFNLTFLFSQIDLKLICTTSTSAYQVKLDVLNNIYLIEAKGISKQNLCDNPTHNYHFISNNADVIANISSPFKIFIYFSSNNTIEFLNNQLSPIGNTLKISDYTHELITLACPSYDNGIWVYNSSQNILIRYNSTFTKTHQSNPITELYNRNQNPTELFEKNEQLYLGLPNYGVLIFDKYGTYQKTIPINYQKQFNIIGTKYYYLFENKLMAYDTKTFEEAIILKEESDIINFDINTNYIAIITQQGIFKLYQIPLL